MVDAFREGDGPGVLGRMLDILEGHGHAVGANAINARVNMIDGSPKTGRLADVFPADGILKIRDRKFLMQESQQLRPFLESLHAETAESSGVFGNAWSQAFVDIWNKTDALAATYRRVQLVTSFPIPSNLNVGGITSQLKQIAMLIRARNERGKGINRDVFYCEMGGYDAHFQVSQVMQNKLPSLNHAVATFWAEIKAQGLASNVVVVQGSEFGRTMTPNSNFVSSCCAAIIILPYYLLIMVCSYSSLPISYNRAPTMVCSSHTHHKHLTSFIPFLSFYSFFIHSLYLITHH